MFTKLPRRKYFTQLMFMLVAAAGLSIAAIWLLSSYFYTETMQASEREQFLALGEAPKNRLSDKINELGLMAIMLAEQPQVHELFQPGSSKNILAQNKSQTANYFKSVLKSERHIMQMRIIKRDGMELIRVDRDSNNPNTIIIKKPDQMQFKGSRTYFRESMQLNPGNFYLSPIELNKEFGQISLPKTWVIRVAAPVYSESVKIQAVVVINYFANALLAQITTNLPRGFQVSIFDHKMQRVISNYDNKKSELEFDFRKLVQTYFDTGEVTEVSGTHILYFVSPVIHNAQNKQPLYLFGAARSSLINPLNIIGINKFTLAAIIFLPALLVFGWWSVLLYFKLQREYVKKADAYRESDVRHQAILNAAVDAIITIDQDGVIESVNPAAEKIFGYTFDEMLGRNISMLMSESDRSEHVKKLHAYNEQSSSVIGVAGREVTALRKNGSKFPIEVGISQMIINGEKKFTGIVRDITPRKIYQLKLERHAYFDTLTNLPNRAQLENRLGQELSNARRHHYYGAVLFIDMDAFKEINDLYGHIAGDTILIQVANRLSDLVRQEDIIGRLGGDEFLAILTGLGSDEEKAMQDGMQVANNVRDKLLQPYTYENKILLLEVSIGVVIYPYADDKNKVVQYIHFADTAMYAAKKNAENKVHMYDDTLTSRTSATDVD